MAKIKITDKLMQKYSYLSHIINEKYININPLQRGGLLTPEAHKALITFGDGYSLCDHCLKGRIDQIENPPVVDFLKDMSNFLKIDNVMPTASARESKRLILQVLAKKYPKRKIVVIGDISEFPECQGLEKGKRRGRSPCQRSR